MRLDRLIGAAFLVASYVPAHRLLRPEATGPAGAATRAAAEPLWQASLLGTLLVLGLALALSRVVDGSRITARLAPLVDALERVPSPAFAFLTGAVATALSGSVAYGLFRGLPTSVDEMTQLAHAAALVTGRLAVPTLGEPAAVALQNGIVVEAGWVSIYPPLHTLALAVGVGVGATWIVGPIFVGAATTFACLALQELLGPRLGRVSGGLLAVTPFWLLLGATQLSHTSAAAGLALVLWAACRARGAGAARWIAVGGALGLAVAARPWIGLAAGTSIILALSWPELRASPDLRWIRRGVAVVAGGAPFAALLLGWNARLFGSPWTLGYAAAFGPAHGLGLHVDPWGNRYGLLEAAAYSGTDLTLLASHLLATPAPALALAGAGLLVGTRRATPPVLATWIIAALAANALYWHHGLHMGPRMLYESTPAWIALLVVGASRLMSSPRWRGLGSWCVVLTVLGGGVSLPATLGGAAGSALASPDAPPLDDGGIAFVHGSWASRITSRLVATGMRRDSIETVLRRNDICAVDRYARWRASATGATPPPALDHEPLSGTPPHLAPVQLSPGNTVRVDPRTPPDPACVREAASDRLGIVELEPLLWRSLDPARGLTLVRDLGPVANRPLLEAARGEPFVYMAGPDGAPPRLVPYEEGMELLWRGASASFR